MLALASRVTRLRLEPEWFAGDFLTAPVTPVPDDPAATTHPKTAALTYDDRPLAWELLRADDTARGNIARIAARYAEAAVAGHEAAKDKIRTRGGRQGGLWFWADAAAREASGPNPLAAAFKSVSAAYLCL